jgi:hypothetical protein
MAIGTRKKPARISMSHLGGMGGSLSGCTGLVRFSSMPPLYPISQQRDNQLMDDNPYLATRPVPNAQGRRRLSWRFVILTGIITGAVLGSVVGWALEATAVRRQILKLSRDLIDELKEETR